MYCLYQVERYDNLLWLETMDLLDEFHLFSGKFVFVLKTLQEMTKTLWICSYSEAEADCTKALILDKNVS